MQNQPFSSADAFEEALDYLYSFINFEMRPQDRYMASKLDKTRPFQLMSLLGNPHNQYPSIHIAGTKGKGSTAAMCAYALRAAGLRVGLYTSPHLIDFRERIRILTPDDADGRIAKADFVDHMAAVKTAVSQLPGITWFEILTAVAFRHFAQEKVDIAVVEVGLGGRLDATNVLKPLVSVITSLSLDHTKLLGSTLADIAYEKGGIIKPEIPVVIAPQAEEARQKLIRLAVERQSPLTEVGKDWQYTGQTLPKGGQIITITRSPDPQFLPPGTTVSLPLLGRYQQDNGVTALAALAHLHRYVPQLTVTAVQQGFAQVQWPGRLQIVHQSPRILVDCAHNPHAAQKLAESLQELFTYNRLFLIFGAPADKDVKGVLEPLLPLAETAVMTTSSHPRAAKPQDLAAIAQELGYTVQTAPNPADSLRQIWPHIQQDDLVCITGSIVVVGDFLNQWQNLKNEESKLMIKD